jgi:hypothetical protein
MVNKWPLLVLVVNFTPGPAVKLAAEALLGKLMIMEKEDKLEATADEGTKSKLTLVLG